MTPMPIPPQKLNAFMQNESSKGLPFGKGGAAPEEPEAEEQEQPEEGEDISQIVLEEADKIQSGQADPQILDVMTDFDPNDSTPPEWAPQGDLWMKAEEAVEPEGAGATQYEDPFMLVAHVYKRLGGAVQDPGGGELPAGLPGNAMP